MKKILLIVAVILTLLLLGLWGYLLLYGKPEGLPWNNSSFEPAPSTNVTESSFSGTPDTLAEPTGTISLDGILIELSSRPTAGAVVFTRDGNDYVRYVERGTGHVFELDLESGTTVRISNTTIPRTTDAVWNKSGTRVAITAEAVVGVPEIVVGTLMRTDTGEQQLTTTGLPNNADNVTFTDQGDSLYYTVSSQAGATGYALDLKMNTDRVLFSIPLREITMLWDAAGSEHYLYTKPSAVMPGNLYRVDSGGLSYIGEAERGLIARRIERETLLTARTGQPGMDLSLLDTDTGVRINLAMKGIPEKCTANSASSTLWCLAPLSAPNDVYPDAWYQGAVSFNDLLWRLDDLAVGFTQALDLESAARETIDGIMPIVSADGTKLIFINKRDGTLWLVNLDRLTAQN